MVNWRKTDTVKYGVAVGEFNGTSPFLLHLNIGDAVLVYEETEDSEWYRGCSLLNRTLKGIFPVSYIHIKWSIDSESTTDVDIARSKELSVVLEITSVLKEWGAIWKQLFVKKSEKCEKLRELLLELMSWRRQVMSGALTADQLKQVKSEVANKIDYGNDFLELDMVVRDTDGSVTDVDLTGVIDLYKRHLDSAQRLDTLRESNNGGGGNLTSNTNLLQFNGHNLYVCIKNVVCRIDDDAEVFITLYDGRENAFISENYLVSWDKQGMPKDLDKLHNLSCLFTDLGSQDLQRDKLYIVCQIIRLGRMDIKDHDRKKLTQNLRRPFGISVLYISDIVQGKVTDDEDKEYFLQLQLMSNEDVDSVIRRSIQRYQAPSQRTGQGIWLSVKMLHGDLQQVKEEHPVLINQFTAIARKQGFPDVIMPGDIRNDMYLTLIAGNFDRGNKSANKNLQVIIAVYDSEGKLLQDVISPGAGEPLASEFFSTVYYHNAAPKWNEVIKISIPTEKVNGSHIRFSFKHRATIDEKDRSQKIFSLAYVNLLSADGTCLQDSKHELAVYKCDAKKIEDCNAYLKLPSNKIEAGHHSKKSVSGGGLTFSRTESFKIGFQLCSTKLAQNVDLLGLLKWRTQKEKLTTILPALHKVSGQEIMKFLQDTFDALFAILTENSVKYGEMVSDAVVFCIGLLADKKYHRFRSILDKYIIKLFSSTKAYITLIDVLQQNIENAQSPDLGADKREHTIKYYKALEYLIKFVVRSRSLSERAAPGKARLGFEGSINSLFSSIMNMMKLSSSQVLPLQGCALKYVPAVFGDLLEAYDASQLGYFARDLVERIPPGRLQTQKLTCIHQLVKSPLFSNPASREVIRPMVVGQLRANMEKFEELKICADIMNEILSSFDRGPDMGDTTNDISYLVSNLFRCIVQTVIRMNLASQLVGNYVAFIVGILDLMKDDHYKLYIESYPNDYELLDGLMELFLVFREFVKDNVYPKAWISMTMIQNNIILRALQYFSEALYDRFLIGENFQYQLWDNFFQLAVAFITQDSLQLEQFSDSKRNKILEKYSDMRMVIGLKIVDMWQFLGINKIKLIQDMVRPFLEMTLIPETELRKGTIPVFFDMIECEFRNRQHFKQVESEVIIHLDHLIETGMKGDEEYKELFSQMLTQKFVQEKKNNPRLCEVGLLFVETISKLLSRLLDYRSVILSEDNINNRMSCTVNILNFYQDIRREEMKERYLYKLCDLHISVGSYTEAAFTLLQHAELLKWSDEPLNNTNTITSNRYQAKTQRELKERLYKDIIDYFDKGKMWEYGISRCKELAVQYETETYDYIQLSEILEKQARFFENIIKAVVRPEPTYFRVGYFGRGFPTFLRNKLFVYRGDEFEKLSDFSLRLQVQFPGAKFLGTLVPPGADITDSIGQWVQVCKVDPKPVERRKFRGKNVAIQIIKFYEVNDVSEFALNRPFHRGKKDKDSEFATLCIERITMNTEYTFPGKLRWFEIKSFNTIELSPIENAVDTVQTKNKELSTLINQYQADDSLSLNPLSMLLNGVIDAAVMGGISNYEKIFFTKKYITENPDHTIYIDILKEAIVEQADICEKGLHIHKQLVSEELKPFHEKMETVFKDTQKKAAPYRKSQPAKNNQLGGSREIRPTSVVHSSRRPRVQSEFGVLGSGSNNTVSSGPPLPHRYTTSPQQSAEAPPVPDKSNRHTTIIGPSSPVHSAISSVNDMMAPALPRKTFSTSPNSPPVPSHSTVSHSYSHVTIHSDEVRPTIPEKVPNLPPPYSPNGSPKPPPKPSLKSSLSNTPPIEEGAVENDEDDEDDPPPPPPKKNAQPVVEENEKPDSVLPPPPVPPRQKPS